MTKMTDAFKKIFLGLGGDPKELAENNDVGDYILDLEGAIKKTASDAVGEVINDSEASDTTTYSSNKITSLIPDTKFVWVIISRPWGQNWEVSFPKTTDRESFVKNISKNYPTILGVGMSFVDNLILVGDYLAFLTYHTDANETYVIYHGIVVDSPTRNLYEMYVRIDADASKDAVYYKAFEFPTT